MTKQLPDPQSGTIPPNEKLLKAILTDAVANLNSLEMGKLGFDDMFGIIMAYGALYPCLKNHNLLEVPDHATGS